MTAARRLLSFCLAAVLFGSVAAAQSSVSSQSSAVPRLVNFTGKATDGGKVITGAAGATFAIYSDESGGAPLWLETQNIQADAKGNYTAQLGATKPEGLPLDLFASGEARWLGVTINGGQEQPRVLLLSVPYALKAADAQTLGGLPASAFVLAAPVNSAGPNSATPSAGSVLPPPGTAVTGTGIVGYVPLWDTTSDIVGSVLFQTGSGTTAKVGINTTTPASTLDVKGGGTVRGTLSLPPTGTATATAGKNSQPLTMAASAFNSTSSTALNQVFEWQVQPAGNNTSAPSGTLNLLFGEGATKPSATGLSIASNGQITFAAGQAFPGAGAGTVSSVALSAPSSDFTVSGSPVTTSGTLGLTWTVAPTNANTPNAIVKRDSNGSFNVGGMVATLGVSGNSTSNSTAGVEGQDSLGGYGVLGVAKGTTGQGVWGESFGTGFSANGQGADGVHGQAHSSNGSGVAGLNSDPNGKGVYAQGGGYGVYASGTGTSATGVYGSGGFSGVNGNNPSGGGYGVLGTSTNGVGVYGSGPTGVTGASSTLVGVAGAGPTGVSGSSTNSTGNGVYGISSGGSGVYGTSSTGIGVQGSGNFGVYGTGAAGLYGVGTGSSGTGVIGTGPTGVSGSSSSGNGVVGSSTTGFGVYATGGSAGVYGAGFTGVAGYTTNSSSGSDGVYGNSANGTGVYGQGPTGVIGSSTNGGTGVSGSGGIGVFGQGPTGVYGDSTGGSGVYATSAHTSSGGWAVNANGTSGATGILAGSDTGYAAWFNGNVDVDGSLTKAGGSFKIDHPLDPANKYLYHSFVESPDMMNIYNGNATLDDSGEAVVTLPHWFDKLNRDFRYQLTCIGGFAPLYIAQKVQNNSFKIGGGRPGMEVSWQVTGIRQDEWANAHRIPVEVEKPEVERGFYLHPELFGAPEDKGILWATAPKAAKQWQEARAKAAAAQKDATPQ